MPTDGIKWNWQFRCLKCDATIDPREPVWQCPQCHGELTVEYESSAPGFSASGTGMWKFAEHLPVPPPAAGTALGEGNSPLVPTEIDGHRIFLKLDSQLPTGSFKDRGAAVLAQYLTQIGVNRIIVDSSGNAASAMSAFAAAFDLDCTVYVPASASPGKLMQARAYGATVIPVDGSRDDVATAAQDAAETDQSASYASHNWHPVFVEGVKTWALEVAEQLEGQHPDWMFVPTGGGSAFVGAWRAYAQDPTSAPQLVACQPAACDPVVKAYDSDSDISRVEAGPTIAEGTKISLPSRPRQIQLALRETDGRAVSVDESLLEESLRMLWSKGFYVEPTAALGVAACRVAIQQGWVGPDQTVVAHITGHGLKATSITGEILDRQS
jgi:threonine synthase